MNAVSDLFLLAFLISSFSIFVFLIKPSLLIRWFKLHFSRRKILSVFGGLSLLTFILFGITAPEVEQKTEVNHQESPVLGESLEATQEAIQTEIEIKEEELFLVTRVIDGDTIEIESGDKVRYIGIDTPETKHPSKPVGCYGKEAEVKNKDLVEGKKVKLEKDISETDKYGRLLRYIYLDGVMINELLVKEGYAQASSYPPDIKYQDKFNDAEKKAREEERGLWGEVCNSLPSPTPTPTPTPTLAPTYAPKPTVVPIKPTTAPPITTSSYSCNCSKTCSNMSSCDEAYYQLNTCGCSRRDGDSDGVPCENICPGG